MKCTEGLLWNPKLILLCCKISKSVVLFCHWNVSCFIFSLPIEANNKASVCLGAEPNRFREQSVIHSFRDYKYTDSCITVVFTFTHSSAFLQIEDTHTPIHTQHVQKTKKVLYIEVHLIQW